MKKIFEAKKLFLSRETLLSLNGSAPILLAEDTSNTSGTGKHCACCMCA